MEYTQFGQTALRVSKISYGTWQFGGDWGQVEHAQWDAGKASVQKALELGINFFDTAQAYGFGLAERMLGEALQPYLKKGLREEIVLATKGGLRMEGDELLRDASPRWLRQGVEQSLVNLGVDSIDLYQVHWPDPNTPIEETAAALDQLVQEGKIRYVGVSTTTSHTCKHSKRSESWIVYSLPTVSSGARLSIQFCLTRASMTLGCSSTVRWRMDSSLAHSRSIRRSPLMTGAARARSSRASSSSAIWRLLSS